MPFIQGWDPMLDMNDTALQHAQKTLARRNHQGARKRKMESNFKMERNVMKEGTQTKQVSCSVFQWLKNRNKSSSQNLIKDDDNNIVYAPIDAIKLINAKWGRYLCSKCVASRPN